jgi:hypothetical protein
MIQEVKDFDFIAVFLKNKFLQDKYVIVRYFLPLSVMRISVDKVEIYIFILHQDYLFKLENHRYMLLAYWRFLSYFTL